MWWLGMRDCIQAGDEWGRDRFFTGLREAPMVVLGWGLVTGLSGRSIWQRFGSRRPVLFPLLKRRLRNRIQDRIRWY